MDTFELLQLAKNEIASLRSQNQLMAARLGVFDDMMMLLKASPVYPSYGATSPDVVYSIDKAIEFEKRNKEAVRNTKEA